MTDPLASLLMRHEGCRRHPYTDSTGHITIGVGRNLTDRGLNDAEITLLLENDMRLARAIADQLFGADFASASPPRQLALLSMAFNLGGPRLAGFVEMRRAIARKDWPAVADAALDSLWARQVGPRATELARMLEQG